MKSTPEDGKALTAQQVEEIKVALESKREELLRYQKNQLSALYSPEKHHLADLEEMAADTTETDSLCTLVDLGSSTLSEIEAALEKIEQGTYGCCELCEKPIHPDRLEVLPFASLCVSCQRKKESQRPIEDVESE